MRRVGAADRRRRVGAAVNPGPQAGSGRVRSPLLAAWPQR